MGKTSPARDAQVAPELYDIKAAFRMDIHHLIRSGLVIGPHVLRVKIGLDSQDVSDLQLAPPFPQGVSWKLPPSAQKLSCRGSCLVRLGFSAGGAGGSGAIREKV